MNEYEKFENYVFECRRRLEKVGRVEKVEKGWRGSRNMFEKV